MNPPPSRPSNPNSHPPNLPLLLSTELLTRHSLPPSPHWLDQFLSTIKSPPPPLPALISTAHFRLLNSDFTHSLLSSSSSPSSQGSTPLLLPPGTGDPSNKSITLQINIPLQVLSIEDVGTSKYTQIEAIERVERGEEVKGREVVRVLPVAGDEVDFTSTSTANDPSTSTSTTNITTSTTPSKSRSQGPHKLLLQDAAGTKIYGFEVRSIPKLFVTVGQEDGGICVGCKVLVKRGTVVRRGLVMLTPEGVSVLGGRVEGWDKGWREGRKEGLKREMAREAGEGAGEG